MPKIVAVHGIGQQLKGPHVLHQEWLPALRDGLRHPNVELSEDDLACAFYGDLFRKPGSKATGIPPLDASDVEDGVEHELLMAWWDEAARIEPQVPGQDAATRLRTPRVIQRALNALSHSRFFAGLVERALIFDLKQVRSYLRDSRVREAVRQRVVSEVAEDTRVLVSHSLGSVVAYECLCAHPEWPIHTFVTLGSPLGIRNLIFDILDPRPQDTRGVWPGSISRWTNIADGGDIVALEKELSSCFGEVGRVEDRLIHNGATAHSVQPYLTARETGNAIALGLR